MYKLSKSFTATETRVKLVYINGNNAAEGGNNIKYANSYLMYRTVEN